MRSKKLALAGLLLILSIWIVSAVNAEIIISQPKALYNLGDELSLTLKVDSLSSGYLDVDLVCTNGQENIYHNVPDSKTINLKRELTPVYIKDLYGDCQVSASYGGNSKDSQNFEISNQIDITLQIDKINVDAGNNVVVKGTAYLKNNQLVGQQNSGFVEISSSSDDLSTGNTIKDGQFSASLAFPETTHAGNRFVNVKVYDKDDQGNVLNSGEATVEVTVIQKLARIELALDKTTINPGENLSLIPFLYDEAGDSVNDNVLITVTDNQSTKLFEGLVSAGKSLIINTKTTTYPGYGIISAEKAGVSVEKIFEINSLKQVSAEIKGDLLIINNTGNVAYNDVVEVKIGNNTVAKEVNLGYGESKEYKISAPDGQYDIALKDGNSENSSILSQSGVALTGDVISFSETGTKLSDVFARYPIVWIFIVVVLAFALWVYYKRHKSGKRLSIPFSRDYKRKVENVKRKGGVEIVNPAAVMNFIASGGDVRKAEQMMTLHGQRQPASIIAIKVKNNADGIARDNLMHALEYGYRKKAVSYSNGNSIILIFSPLITGKSQNEEVAIKAALDIDNALKDHNRKFRNDKLVYGIGVNSGSIINKMEGKVLQFASIDKTINLAKKVADLASNDVLLSKDIHEKTSTSVKTDKFASGGMDLFTVKRVVNTEQSQKFMNEFMRRNSTK